jgi:glutamate/tyrosine decarboxylase-like PLP-dependent enzyme
MPTTLPTTGLRDEDILAALAEFKAHDTDWEHGRTFSLVYHAGAAHKALLEKVHALFGSTNALNPMAFGSLRRLEAEVVRMTAGMLHGPASAVGTMTTGGTESILLAVKAARDKARAERPKITRPNVVVPESIHVAFDKAASYFGLEIRYARMGDDLRVDVRDLEGLIDANTVLIAASAPQYPHGVIDPIETLAALAQRRGIPFHVDACFGGFVLPWIEKLGHPVSPWDFRVPGVTSISADVHKYGFAAKGASVIVYRDMSYLRHQFFISTDWPGGIYASPSIPGTRSGSAIAAAWASMVAMGEAGYLSHTDRAMKAVAALREGLEAIPELEVLGQPEATIVSWTTRKDSGIDVYALADRLTDRDWNVDRQQNPNCIHCTVTSNHAAVIGEYLDDVRAAVAYLRSHPDETSRGNAAMYGMMAKVPFRGMVKKSVLEVMERLYGPHAAEPDFDLLGQDESGGAVTRLVKRYGGRALGLLDKLDGVSQGVRQTLGLAPRRRR